MYFTGILLRIMSNNNAYKNHSLLTEQRISILEGAISQKDIYCRLRKTVDFFR